MTDFHDDSEVTAVRDAAADKELEFDVSKCQVDPVKAQDDALLSVALKLREGKLAVNEYQVEEARTTMVRSNYAPDWTKANWQHPLLAGLKNLSSLSSSDFPSHTKHGLVDERKAIDRVARNGSESEPAMIEDVKKEQQGGDVDNDPQNRRLVPTEVSDRLSLDAVRPEVADPAVIQRAIDHGVVATIEASPFILSQKALLQLSSETINSDPQLLALVSAVAQRNKSDPIVAGRVAMGDTPTIPVDVIAPAMRNQALLGSTRRKATDALPDPSCRGNTNKGFHASDIDGYSHLRGELSESTHSPAPKSMHHVPAVNVDENAATSGAAYRTWSEKHLDKPSEYEDMENFQAYREEVTSLEGKCLAITSKYSSSHN